MVNQISGYYRALHDRKDPIQLDWMVNEINAGHVNTTTSDPRKMVATVISQMLQQRRITADGDDLVLASGEAEE